MNRGVIGALSLSVSFALLGGCGGSQPPISARGVMPQARAIKEHVERSKSWMLPEAKNQDLIYVSDLGMGAYGIVDVLTYPKGDLIGSITDFPASPAFLCSDDQGNVFVPTSGTASQSYVYEFAHGGTTPIATLSDPGYAQSCAFDHTTGNLAVANGNTVAIYQNAQGGPTIYESSDIAANYCSYDGSGNLFVDGMLNNTLGELPKNGSTFESIPLSQDIGPISIQWNNGSFAISGGGGNSHGPQEIFQVSITGSEGIVSGPTRLIGKRNRKPNTVQFWIQGNTIIGPDRGSHDAIRLLNLWNYPQGGKAKKSIKLRRSALFGVTVSLAPHR